jgi:single-strand DNA-binding protein
MQVLQDRRATQGRSQTSRRKNKAALRDKFKKFLKIKKERSEMINSVVLMGRLTADPELRQTQNGTSVTSFTVAVDRRFQRGQTDFINIVAWKQTAEFVEKYFKKGAMIALRGNIQQRNYEDKNGNKRTAFEVIADEVSFCGSKAEKPQTPNNDDFEEIPISDDLPF